MVLIFLNDCWCCASFHLPVGHLYIFSLEKYLFKSFAYLKMRLFVFSLLNYKSSLYILDIGPLLDIWLADIFYCGFSFHFLCAICISFLGLLYNHKLGGIVLKQQKSILSQFWRPEVWNQGVSRVMFSLKSRPGSSSFWWPQAFLGLWPHHSNLYHCFHMAFFPACLSGVLFSSYKDTRSRMISSWDTFN